MIWYNMPLCTHQNRCTSNVEACLCTYLCVQLTLMDVFMPDLVQSSWTLLTDLQDVSNPCAPIILY
jgi:hypothetical protein